MSRFWDCTKISNLKRKIKVNTFLRFLFILRTTIWNLRTRKWLLLCLFYISVGRYSTDLYLQIWLAINNKLKSHLAPRIVKNKLFLLLHLFHCVSNLIVFVGDKVWLLMTKSAKSGKVVLLIFFPYEICLIAETIQK